jgi:hypothetical protein
LRLRRPVCEQTGLPIVVYLNRDESIKRHAEF